MDEKGAIKELPPSGAELFFQDVLADGKVVTKDSKGALALPCEATGGKARTRSRRSRRSTPTARARSAARRRSSSSVRSRRAIVTVPMSATVRVRYRETEPRMGIFRWHASVRPEPVARAK